MTDQELADDAISCKWCPDPIIPGETRPDLWIHQHGLYRCQRPYDGRYGHDAEPETA